MLPAGDRATASGAADSLLAGPIRTQAARNPCLGRGDRASEARGAVPMLLAGGRRVSSQPGHPSDAADSGGR
eukprot:scaffold48_cov395-Prasinococcus_capsulatus_cf.AAC.19